MAHIALRRVTVGLTGIKDDVNVAQPIPNVRVQDSDALGLGPRVWTADRLQVDRSDSGNFLAGKNQTWPADMCQWSIHKDHSEYAGREDAWPEEWHNVSTHERLRNAIERGDFSRIKPRELPVALPLLAKSTPRIQNGSSRKD